MVDPKLLLDDLARAPRTSFPFLELVRPLVNYDRDRRSDLLHTLSVYFETGTNARKAADRLFLHRNSLLYRLERIGELTDLDLKESDARLALQIGLLAFDKSEKGEQEDADQHP